MKVFKTKSLLLSLLLIVVVNFSLSAQDAQKTYTESYDVSKGVTLASDTKYSDVELLSWEKDVVDIVVEVEVDASSKSRAEELLDKIEVEISKSGNTINLETDLDNGWHRNSKFEINVTIQAPAYINLNMENGYGDIFIQEVNGLALIDLKYGNMKAGTLGRGNSKPYNVIELAYSNAEVDVAGWLEAELAYSDLELNSSDMLFVESKYSKVIGEQAGGIIAEGAYDKYYLDEIDSFVAELKYSGIKFGRLTKTLSLQSGYTNAKIENLSKDFDEVEASLSYGNIHLGPESGASYKFEGEAKYGNVHIDAGERMSKTKENNYTRVWGNVGSNPKSSMKITTKYGNIHID